MPTFIDTNWTMQGVRRNLITEKVTSRAAIFVVPPRPGFKPRTCLPATQPGVGFIASSVLVGTSGSLYLAFKRRGWVKNSDT